AQDLADLGLDAPVDPLADLGVLLGGVVEPLGRIRRVLLEEVDHDRAVERRTRGVLAAGAAGGGRRAVGAAAGGTAGARARAMARAPGLGHIGPDLLDGLAAVAPLDRALEPLLQALGLVEPALQPGAERGPIINLCRGLAGGLRLSGRGRGGLRLRA